jgi:hypothetical protein
MGTVVRFPIERRAPSHRRRGHGPDVSADIVILPAVRIERIVEPIPHPSKTPSGRMSARANQWGPLWS